ncbi:hypothetical protein ACOSQ2_001059 [Xanthoceras sorbifolium]
MIKFCFPFGMGSWVYRHLVHCLSMQPGGESYNWNELAIQNFEVAEECLKINYYGAKRMIEAHISLLQLSDSARMVNVIINFRDINERSITKRAVRISTPITGDIYSHVGGKCTNHFTKSRCAN